MEDLLKGLNIYLVGMMGTGKSTLAKIIAEIMNYRVLDSDDIIEQLGLGVDEVQRFNEGINRPNLELSVQEVWSEEDKLEQLLEIFGRTQKRADELGLSDGGGIV